MFEHHRGRPDMRHRRQDERGDIGRQLREELRRNLRHGAGHRDANFGDLFGGRRGPVVRRGEIRSLILGALTDKPMHGYEVIQALESQSEGRWRPSAGSIYPTLQLLSDEGLVSGEDLDGRRVYTLTDEGRKAAEAAKSRSPWTDTGGDENRTPDVMHLAMQLGGAVVQVQRTGSPAARLEAVKILTEARKQLYRLLSEDEEA